MNAAVDGVNIEYSLVFICMVSVILPRSDMSSVMLKSQQLRADYYHVEIV